ncbi:MAG: HlyD family type I secretion periplasmic adaptor subunit [Gallionella sp.]|nr:HlyD family type I secretion periplasmic adaptor subunit [Gallionella sp.]
MAETKQTPKQSAQPEDLHYMRDLHAAMLEQSAPKVIWALYLIGVVLVAALIWASLAEVEEITEGEGKVIPISGEQIIQSLEGGILAELNVKEGQVVEKGQGLLKIDPTRATASYQESYNKMIALMGSVTRLRAEVYGKSLEFPPEVEAYPDIVRNERESFRSKRHALEQSVAGLERSLALIEKEIEMTAPLVARGLISDLELIKSKRQANDTRVQITERKNKFIAEANQELVRAESELAQARENAIGREDTMKRTLVKAPVKGTVKNIKVTTIGGVIPPATDIMEIVPFEDQLLIEAKILPKDVAFLRPGLESMVKVTAYDYSVYGGLSGTLEHISPDTLREDRPNAARVGVSDVYYKVIVRTTSASLKRGDKEFAIIPGMTTTVQIKTGKKTILEYLLKPVFKAREAFRER